MGQAGASVFGVGTGLEAHRMRLALAKHATFRLGSRVRMAETQQACNSSPNIYAGAICKSVEQTRCTPVVLTRVPVGNTDAQSLLRISS